MNERETFDRACDAIAAVLPRFADLVRRHPGVTATAVGSWSPAEVACHVTHVLTVDTDSVAGGELPPVELSPAAVGVMTNAMLATDTERDVAVLADRVESLGTEFLRLRSAPPTAPVTWIGGTQLPASAVACHLLEELLVHGHDIASAARASWPIEPAHAALAILGAAVPIIAASPASWLSPRYDPAVHARVEFRLRGFESFALAVANGLHVESPPRTPTADARVSADPAALLLVMLGRQSHWRAVLRGKVIVWGRRPQAVLTLLRSINPP